MHMHRVTCLASVILEGEGVVNGLGGGHHRVDGPLEANL